MLTVYPEAIYTPLCGIYRHDSMFNRIGYYSVIMRYQVVEYLDFLDPSILSKRINSICVVDDFGNLVSVGEYRSF